MKQIKLVAFTTLFCVFFSILPPPVKAQSKNIEERIENLLRQMTFEEKLGQLQQTDGLYGSGGRFKDEQREIVRKGKLGAFLNVRGAKNTNDIQRVAVEESRLKIPLMFGYDVIHGYRTIMPVALGEASSFDPQVAERSAAIAAKESRAAGVNWTFAPMVDIARDPRWGRIVEGSGEDTYLGSVFAAARVRGFQGSDYSQPDRVVACAKHWVGYGAAEAGRDYNTTILSERSLRTIYFPPFKAAIDAGVGTFMSGYNELDSIPTTANKFILTQVLQKEWKFDGFVVSDYNSVSDLMNHGMTATEAEAAHSAFDAGVHMEMVSQTYNKNMAQLMKEGKLSEAQLNEAVRRILRIKFRLGLFENPYVDEAKESQILLNAEHLKAAREIAARSMVLLKNQNDVLPFKKDVGTVAVIGPLADDQQAPMGSWNAEGKKEHVVTLLSGIRGKVSPSTKVLYAKGTDIEGASNAGFAEAVNIAKQSDAIILAVGEAAEMSGEARSRTNLNLPGNQLDLIKAVHATGKPYALVLMNGRPLTINWENENSPAILETWFAGTQAGNAIADVLFGDVNPGGKLPVTFPRNVGQIPLYYNYKNTGKPASPERHTSKYLDSPNTPLYPFGYGLSYTKFKISNLQLNTNKIRPDGSVKVSVDVENVGQRVGDEVVQLYIRDPFASVTRSVKELKGFERITLNAGEKRKVEFTLTPEHLGLYNQEMRFVVEPGIFKVMVGNSSETELETNFEVTQ